MQWRELYLLRFGPKPEGLQKLLILLNFTCIKADLCIHLKKKCLLQMPISAMHDQMNEWCLKMLKNLEFSFFSIPHNIVYRSQKESLVNKKNLYWQDLKHFISFLGFLVTENPRTIVIYLHSSIVTNVIEVIKAYCL